MSAPSNHPNPSPQPATSRRGFFVTAARGAMLFVLGAFGLQQEIKRRRLAADPKCLKLTPCAACGEFGLCPKPKAQEARATNSR